MKDWPKEIKSQAVVIFRPVLPIRVTRILHLHQDRSQNKHDDKNKNERRPLGFNDSHRRTNQSRLLLTSQLAQEHDGHREDQEVVPEEHDEADQDAVDDVLRVVLTERHTMEGAKEEPDELIKGRFTMCLRVPVFALFVKPFVSGDSNVDQREDKDESDANEVSFQILQGPHFVALFEWVHLLGHFF